MDAADSHNLPFRIKVWPDGQTPRSSPEDGDLPRLTCYLPSDEFRTGHTILIFPGGGYRMVSTAKEGHRPAQLLSAHGIATAVLEYRHFPQLHPVPLMDAQRAMRLIRGQAARTDGLDPDAVGCMGFSAGAHLAGTLATHPSLEEGNLGDEISGLSCRPNFFVMIYPVVSFAGACAHIGSRGSLLGPDDDPALAESLSIERIVTPETPPCFIAHGQADETTVPDHSILLYQSLTRNKVPATMHIYQGLGHGVGLAANHAWGRDLIEWLSADLG